MALPKKYAPLLIGLFIIIGLVGLASYWILYARFIESTDNAYIEADIAALSPQVAGLVVEVLISDHQSVSKGDLLLRIDDSDFQVKLLQAQAGQESAEAMLKTLEQQLKLQQYLIEQAEAQLNQAIAEKKLSHSDSVRYIRLEKQQSVSEQQLQQAIIREDKANAAFEGAKSAIKATKTNSDVLKAQLVQASAELKISQAQVQYANLQVQHSELRAPFSGIIGNKNVAAGQFIQPGLQVFSLVPSQAIYVTANFKETQMAKLAIGQQAALHIDALGDEKISGTVNSFSPASGSRFSLLPPENATGNFTKIVQRIPVRISINANLEQLARIRPGMSVLVDINTRDKQ